LTRHRPTSPPLSHTDRKSLDGLVRRGARALNPIEGNRLLALWEQNLKDREQERRVGGGAQAQLGQVRQQLAALRAGEEPVPGHGIPQTPGQWIAAWNGQTPEQRLAHAQRILDAYTEITQAEDRIAAVRALHVPVEDRTGWTASGEYESIIPACQDCGSEDYAVAWPCSTLRALGLDEES
jgi:hypothetical protein